MNEPTSEERISNLRNALAKCLSTLHDYFGLTEEQMKAALDDAEVNPKWSQYDDKKWTAVAYPKDTNQQTGTAT